MPQNCEFDEEEAEEFIENGGVSRNTRIARERTEGYFLNFVKSTFADDIESIENGDFWLETNKVEKALIKYFGTYRKKNGKLPKGNTVEQSRSFIKTMIKGKTKLKVDISNEIQFPDWTRFWKGLLGKLKHNGNLDTEHYDTLTEEELKKMNDFLKVLFNLMKLNRNDEKFHEYLEQIPEEYKDNYNYLALYGAICIVIFQVSSPIKNCRSICFYFDSFFSSAEGDEKD